MDNNLQDNTGHNDSESNDSPSNDSPSNDSPSNDSPSNNSQSNNSQSNNSQNNNTQSNNSQNNNTQSNDSPSNSPSNNTQNNLTNNFTDISNNISNNILNYTLNEILTDNITTIINQQGTDISNQKITNTIFNTDISINIDVNISENLLNTVEIYDNTQIDTSSNILLNEIKSYAQQISCSDFQGKGTIDDYNQLFIAASKIANDTKQMNLDIDTQGFSEFANAADELAGLFNGFIIRLQNVNIINDESFLLSILDALKKIVNLSNVFGKFKETILATTQIQIPKSALETANILTDVTNQINCAMGYISYFIDSNNTLETPEKQNKAQLSTDEQNIISKAVSTIENWQTLCDNGVSVALNHNPEIISINNINNQLSLKSTQLKNMTANLKLKLSHLQNI